MLSMLQNLLQNGLFGYCSNSPVTAQQNAGLYCIRLNCLSPAQTGNCIIGAFHHRSPASPDQSDTPMLAISGHQQIFSARRQSPSTGWDAQRLQNFLPFLSFSSPHSSITHLCSATCPGLRGVLSLIVSLAPRCWHCTPVRANNKQARSTKKVHYVWVKSTPSSMAPCVYICLSNAKTKTDMQTPPTSKHSWDLPPRASGCSYGFHAAQIHLGCFLPLITE